MCIGRDERGYVRGYVEGGGVGTRVNFMLVWVGIGIAQ